MTYLWINLLIQTQVETIVLLRGASPAENSVTEKLRAGLLQTLPFPETLCHDHLIYVVQVVASVGYWQLN